jgi:hypothetical protein
VQFIASKNGKIITTTGIHSCKQAQTAFASNHENFRINSYSQQTYECEDLALNRFDRILL